MHIQRIQVDRFANLSRLTLENLKPHLNVVFGPAGSGKTAIAQFLRQHLIGGPGAACGVHGHVVLAGDRGAFRITRGAAGEPHVSELLSGRPTAAETVLPACDDRLFRLAFSVGFRGELDTGGALQAAARRFQAAQTDETGTARLRQLEMQRSEWLRSHNGESPLDWIARRRQHLLAQLEEADRRRRQSREELQRLAHERAEQRRVREGRLQQVQHELAELSVSLQQLEQRYRQLTRDEEQLRSSGREGRELAGRIGKLTEQILRWRRIHCDVIERRDRLRKELVDWATGSGEAAAELQGPPGHIADLEQQIHDVKATIKNFQRQTGSVPRCGCGEVHQQCLTQLQQMRETLYHLCEDLSKQLYKVRRSEINNELKQLRRCHADVTEYLKRLLQRRRKWMRELAAIDRAALAQVVHEQNTICRCEEHASLLEHLADRELEGPLAEYAQLRKQVEETQSQLSQQRDRQRGFEQERRRLEQELGQLDQEPAQAESYSEGDAIWIEEKRRELAQLDAEHQLRLEEWEALTRQIEEAQREARRTRIIDLTPELLEESSHYLREVTSGDYRRLTQSSETGRLIVENREGARYSLEAIRRESRDLTHLAACLAIVATCARHGLRAPLLLDDLFTHLDSDRVDAVASVLQRFAEHDRQTIVLTDNEFAAHRLSGLGAGLQTLAAAPAVLAPAAFAPPQAATPPPPIAPPQPVVVRPSTIVYGQHQQWDSEEFPGELSDRVRAELRLAAERRTKAAEIGAAHHEPAPPAPAPTTDAPMPPLTGASVDSPLPSPEQPLALAALDGFAADGAEPTTTAGRESGTTDDTWSDLFEPEPTLDADLEEETYYLTGDSALDEVPEMPADVVAALRTRGIVTVEDFRSHSAVDLAETPHIRLSSAQLRRRQAMAHLLCDVKNLRPYDVRILTGAGVETASQLRETHSSELLKRVEHFVRTPEGRAVLVSGDDLELARVAHWVRSARESRVFDQDAERRRRARDNRADDGERKLSVLNDSAGDRERSTHGRRWSRDTRASSGRESTGGRSQRGSGSRSASRSGSSRSRSSSTSSDRRRSTEREPRSGSNRRSRSRRGSERQDRESGLQFYLERASDVEAAPSIGPKMAEHLAGIGVHTVDDLLSRDAAQIAEQLDLRRVSAETVRLWQLQAAWMCRVPLLRGHDAQILVGCGYQDVEQLQGVTPEALLAQVKPFVESKEGRRILRGGKKPNLEEVRQWIHCVQRSRQLRAA